MLIKERCDPGHTGAWVAFIARPLPRSCGSRSPKGMARAPSDQEDHLVLRLNALGNQSPVLRVLQTSALSLTAPCLAD